jgi:metal-sulfur cluster biosynthetic enzyme
VSEGQLCRTGPAVELPREAALPATPADTPLWNALREVNDPEIPISLVDLGLIYDIRQEGETVEVDLTFTATGCPCTVFIRQDIEERLLREPGVEAVAIQEVWNPPWTKERITPEGRLALKKFGVGL